MHEEERNWAKLGGSFSSPKQQGLQRGVWYRVTSVHTQRHMVTLDIDGQDAEVHDSFLKFRSSEPTKSTRVPVPETMPEKSPGEPVAMLSYRAVCPKGHELGDILLSADRVQCPGCAVEYELEDDR